MYKIGQQICLWFINHSSTPDQIQVSKEVIVTITEEKTGVPGEFSGRPVDSQSLRGTGDDGRIYEKHWESWPESQTNDYLAQWSSDLHYGWDIPFEAFRAYNNLQRIKRRNPEFRLIGPDGKEIRPKGDNLFHCEKHDRYELDDSKTECFWCLQEIRRTADHRQQDQLTT